MKGWIVNLLYSNVYANLQGDQGMLAAIVVGCATGLSRSTWYTIGHASEQAGLETTLQGVLAGLVAWGLNYAV